MERWLLAEEIGAFVRHELRNKLTSMKAALFLLNKRLRSEQPEVVQAPAEGVRPAQRSIVLAEILGQEVERTNDLLGMLPPNAPSRRIETLSARACIEQAAACVALDPGVHVETKVEPAGLEIDADPAEVVVAVRCLIENAVESLGDGGGQVTVAARAEGEAFVVEVRDDGRGIPHGERSDVMRSFYSTKEGHPGLGLPLAQRVAGRYSGDLILAEGEGGRALLRLAGTLGPPPRERPKR